MLLFCSSICRMPTPPCTKRNNGTRQEHADNNRIVRKINANKNAKQTRNSDREFANCIMQSAGPSANLQIRGRRCSRRMAHSDPPAPFHGARGVSDRNSQFCRLQKPLPHPALPADPTLNFAFCRPLRLKCRTFGSLFADRKFIENPTPEKAP